MATITIDNFGGIAPRIHPTLLGNNMAVKAHNCMLKSGKLVPIKNHRYMNEVKIHYENGLKQIRDANSIYVWHRKNDSVILAWPGFVDISPSNLSNDNYSRIFISGETGVGGNGENGNHPCVYLDNGDNGIIRHDLVKEVLPAPVVKLKNNVPSDTENVRYTSYIQTWVDNFGYESSASNPSSELEYTDGDAVVFLALTDVPKTAAKRRIYKVITGSETESFQFIFEQEASRGFFPSVTKAIKDEDAGEIMPHLLTPSEDLHMITKIPGNFYVGVRRSNLREVRFSESANPSSWLDAYTVSIFDDIVGIGVTLNTIFVLTKNKPWAITGSSPAEMTPSILASAEGCVSRRSICTYNGAVFYASANGLCMLQDSSSTTSIVTEKLFSRKEWQALHPEDCLVAAYANELYMWFPSAEKYLILNLQDEANVAVTTHETHANCVYVDDVKKNMVFVGERK